MEDSVTAFAYKAATVRCRRCKPFLLFPRCEKTSKARKRPLKSSVHPTGKFLYASNRAGIDTISAFSSIPPKARSTQNEYPPWEKPAQFRHDPPANSSSPPTGIQQHRHLPHRRHHRRAISHRRCCGSPRAVCIVL